MVLSVPEKVRSKVSGIEFPVLFGCAALNIVFSFESVEGTSR